MAALATVLILVFSICIAAFCSSVINNSPIDAVALPLPPYPTLEGVYTPNTLLQNVEKLGIGRLLNPEDMALDPTRTFLYTGTSDGWIKKFHIRDGSVEDWKHVGGRPLGLAIGSTGEVLVCEPSQGLLKVTDEGVEVLATEVDGTKFNFVNGVTVSEDGLVYFTDSSTKYKLVAGIEESLEGRPNGLILVYNTKEKSTKVLVNNLYMPNGIALSKNREFLVFTETTAARISKYYLKGQKKGTIEIINENLPGFPDNIHYGENAVLYTGIINKRDAISDLIWKLPFLKKALALYPFVFHTLDTSRKMARVLAIDENGKPVKSYQDPTGKDVGFICGAVEVDGYLYIAGLRDDFIGRVKV